MGGVISKRKVANRRLGFADSEPGCWACELFFVSDWASSGVAQTPAVAARKWRRSGLCDMACPVRVLFADALGGAQIVHMAIS